MSHDHSSPTPTQSPEPEHHHEGCGVAGCHKNHHHVQQPHRVTKIGRNDICPCGSGKKYKKCCLV